MLRSAVREIIGVSCLITLLVIFFARLFVPHLNLIVTPDFGRTDAWHFSFATKFALSESLKSGHLPLWNKDMGGGFPLFAEGQTGALYLPNLILFSLWPPVVAYNLALAISFLFLLLGMYAWMRITGCSVMASLFAAITVTFSALPVLQLTHITLLQGISMLPIIGALTYLLMTRGPFPWMSLLALAVSQQVFAGFPQASFLTGCLVLSYALFLGYSQKKLARVVWFGLGYVLAIGISAAQLMASAEFLGASTNPSGFDGAQASYFSFPLKHFMTFFAPFGLGNPKEGTYPPFYAFDGSIFWENTAWVGLLPLFLLFYGILRGRKNKEILFFLWVLGISFVLAWGKYSPLYFIFSIPPFSLFRVPSRFLWIAIISISVIGANTIDRIHAYSRASRTKVLLILCIVLQCIQLFSTFWSYHVIEPATDLMTPPVLAELRHGGKVYTIGEAIVHNRIFLSEGWQHPDHYALLRQGIGPDTNILWHIPQQEVYAGRFLRRQSLTAQLLSNSISLTDHTATFSATTSQFLNLFGITDVIAFLPLTQTILSQPLHIGTSSVSLDTYTNPEAVPRAYLVTQATTAATLVESKRILEDPSFIPGHTVLLESHEVQKHPDLQKFLDNHAQANTTKSSVRITKDSNQLLEMDLATDTAALLILTDTLYPGWTAFVDGKVSPILAANISQRAVMIPQGAHTVTFSFVPQTVSRGLMISILMFILTVGLMVAPIGALKARTGNTAHRLGRHPSHNRET